MRRSHRLLVSFSRGRLNVNRFQKTNQVNSTVSVTRTMIIRKQQKVFLASFDFGSFFFLLVQLEVNLTRKINFQEFCFTQATEEQQTREDFRCRSPRENFDSTLNFRSFWIDSKKFGQKERRSTRCQNRKRKVELCFLLFEISNRNEKKQNLSDVKVKLAKQKKN